ncbi:hypothetical protein RI578_16800 [Streptomyces sp. BB1-1-1]|uniref:hypothetical protein n=1 Tax=Streptomyces sp. BB1-1-1 TaxID=3074430 RepID=UPI0028777969|nr:hypothetical protein [Streptomyces sp. BB1-1-1]WND35847.1 hypothetical protein RI578_16800 [Streptomyces sp. BB1-1-1]
MSAESEPSPLHKAYREDRREVVAELIDLARSHTTTTDQAGSFAACAIEILFWQDRFTEAADLAEEVILARGATGQSLTRMDIPFDMALLAAEKYAGVKAAPRMQRLRTGVPEKSVLGRRLAWLVKAMADRPLERLLASPQTCGGPSAEVTGPATGHLGRPYGNLGTSERRVLWEAVRNANRFDLGRNLHEFGEPPVFESALWLAGWYQYTGSSSDAEEVLVRALDVWHPLELWDILPEGPVLQPVLREAVTDRVRHHYLTHPIEPVGTAP